MKIPVVLRAAMLCGACVLSAGCTRPSHEHEQTAAAAEIDPLVTTLFGERVLLFVEYPHLVRGVPARFLAHFSVLATGEPIRAGRVTLEVGGTALAVDAPKRDGLFVPEGSFPQAGRFSASIRVTSDQVEEALALGEIVVHESEEGARAAAQAVAGEDPPGAVPFLMEQQWKVELLLVQAASRRLARRLIVSARVVLAQGASAIVSPPLAGRLLPPEGGELPHSGDAVVAGQVLGLLEPPLTAADAAQLRALDLEWDLRVLEVERAAAEAAARLHFAERERERLAQLRPSGLVTQAQLDEAERDLALAHGAMEAARVGRQTLERLRAERGDAPGGTSGAEWRLALSAPIAGIVVEVGRVLGESVEPGERLFRILDPTRLWIEGRVSEFDLAQLRGSPEASASFPALPGLRVDLGGAGRRALEVLPEVDEASRTVVVRGELSVPIGELRPGLLAELEIEVEAVDAGVVVPQQALVMDQGQPTAYVMLSGETFQRRDLELGVRDGEWVEVRAGLLPGERVATRGATTIRLAALSPASFGAGHAH